ncbi:MAG TPA: SBBP repeat-containing protein, partial [Ferruginibacter sp.]|nr:SBBP repeat-containing protein [Ferruginibacter sp.]
TLALCVNVAAQEFNWVRSIGGSTAMSGNTMFDYVQDATIDKWGNAYVAGRVGANPKVNGVSVSPGGYGAEDGYLAKFDRCGNLEWMRIMGKNLSDFTAGVAVDDAGNVYVTGRAPMGQFYSPCKDTLFPVNSAVTFVAKYDGAGCMKWLKGMNGFSAFPWSRNIKMGSDGKLRVWMGCQPHASPVVDTISITYFTNMFMRMDTNGVIEYYKFVDVGSTNLANFQLEENNNLCLYYSNGDDFNPTNYSIAGKTFALDIDGSLMLRLDSNFEYLSHEQNYKVQILGYETDMGKLYTHVILQKGAYLGEDTFTTIKARFNYQEVLRSSDLNFQKLALSQPDTQRNAQIGTTDLCISGDYVYLTLTNSAGYMKWSNINLLNFGSMVSTIGVLVRFNKHTLEGELLDTIYGYRGVSGFDIVNVMERDRQGNIYMAGLFAGALYLGDTVTPN